MEEDAVYQLLGAPMPDRWALGMNAISHGEVYCMPMKANAHPQLIKYPAQPPTGNTNSRFLDKLPIEIRNEIYKYLLYNPMLADLAHVHVAPPGLSGSKYVAYNLSPAILQICRHVNAEASIVLYEFNKFHYVATGPHNHLSHSREHQRLLIEITPISRYFQYGFRSLQSITFVDADSNNLPSVLTGAAGPIVYETNLSDQALEDEIRELVTGC